MHSRWIVFTSKMSATSSMANFDFKMSLLKRSVYQNEQIEIQVGADCVIRFIHFSIKTFKISTQFTKLFCKFLCM